MRRFLLIQIFVLIVVSGFSQRHTKCDNGFEFLLGATQFGEFFKVGVAHLGYVKYFSDHFYGKFDLLGSMEKDRGLPHRAFGVDITLARTLFQINDSWYFNVIGGGTISMEHYIYQKKYDMKKYGLFLGGEVEHYFNEKWSLLINAQNRYLLGEDKLTTRDDVIWGKQRWYASVGIRYHFYRENCARPSTLQRSK